MNNVKTNFQVQIIFVLVHSQFNFFFQVAAVKAATTTSQNLDPEAIQKRLLPRSKAILEDSSTDVPLTLIVLSCLERTLDKLERSTVIDDILPILYDVKLQDPEVAVKVVSKQSTFMQLLLSFSSLCHCRKLIQS